MSRTTVVRMIDAPLDKVVAAVADVRNFAQIATDVTRIEFLSDQQEGVGTRFRETREMRGKEQEATLELTAYVENEHVRFVSDEHGTVWDSVFEVRTTDAGTELTLTMEARAFKLLPKLMNPLIKGMIAKEMDAVKAWCEISPSPTTPPGRSQPLGVRTSSSMASGADLPNKRFRALNIT